MSLSGSQQRLPLQASRQTRRNEAVAGCVNWTATASKLFCNQWWVSHVGYFHEGTASASARRLSITATGAMDIVLVYYHQRKAKRKLLKLLEAAEAACKSLRAHIVVPTVNTRQVTQTVHKKFVNCEMKLLSSLHSLLHSDL